MKGIITEWPQYFTATNLDPIAIGWKKLLQPDKYKDIVIDTLRFLVNDERIKLTPLLVFPVNLNPPFL